MLARGEEITVTQGSISLESLPGQVHLQHVGREKARSPGPGPCPGPAPKP